ncbi:MAG: (d)CMP kinase, partial [Bacteroidia bacterium]|nr:(d)CMP kinase [Bacteroidia bacterium]MDW8333334.1 (d)CMP kinase [Bacteroidia bacterium]
QALDYLYIDTGAMYRAFTYGLLREKIDFENETGVLEYLERVQIGFTQDDAIKRVTLNGAALGNEIRSPDVSACVGVVSAYPAVRRYMVERQRKIGAGGGVVMDGRDIGTVVFPGAELKVFMVAELETRVRRRLAELRAAGFEADEDAVRQDLVRRDHMDANRTDGPLRKADDALELDTTFLSVEGQVAQIVAWVHERIATPVPL